MEPMGRTTIEGRWVALGSDKQTLNDSEGGSSGPVNRTLLILLMDKILHYPL